MTANVVRLGPTLNFRDITTKSLNGTGLFDELMAVVKEHLQQEFSSQRIRGPEYAKVYLGSMEAVLAQTVQYLTANALVEEQRTKLELEAEMLREQLKMMPYELEKVQAQVELAKLQVKEMTLKLELIPLQKAQLELQNSRLSNEIALVGAQVDLTRLQAQEVSLKLQLFPLQKAQLELQNSRISNEIALLVAQNRELNYRIDNVYPAELKKTQAEVALLGAKTTTEQQQPSLIQKQIAVYDQQIWGYLRDAEYKVAKVYADTWQVQKSVDEGVTVPSGLTNAEIYRAMIKLLNGIQA